SISKGFYKGVKKSGFGIILGTPKKQMPSWVENLNITILDTTKNSDYFNVLKSLDILVTYYDKNRYFYRASGVISDAGSSGCYIIAPDYPLIRHQITWPVSIGQTFSHLDEIEDLLNQAFDHIKTYGQDNQWLWRNKRDAQYIAQLFNNLL
ncbi:hypothetical protein, partial [Crocosphaera sp. Alani8]|uniref:hypothetical protein n=1 Tax=Crocosphaera sp. Alani8 TaxID=3038952 RepID=UPI00313B8EE3